MFYASDVLMTFVFLQDLCVTCFENKSYAHRTDDLDLEEGEPLTPQEARRRSLQSCVESLLHVSQCQFADCNHHSCLQMKRHCLEGECTIPFCISRAKWIKQKQLQQRMQQAMLRRRMAQMQRTSSSLNAQSAVAAAASTPAVAALPEP